MRILYIIPSLQHPKLGGPTRHYHFVKELSQRHEITLLALVRSTTDPVVVKEIESYTDQFYMFNVNGEIHSPAADIVGKLPILGKYLEKNIKLRDGIRDMKRAFERLVKTEPYDLVLFHGKSIFPVIEDCNSLPIVTDFCDATSLRIGTSMRYRGLLRAPFYFLKMLKMRRLEKRLIEKSNQVAFISSRDREAVLGPEDRSPLLPLGVDNNFWQRRNGAAVENCIVFTGVMDYAPNHDAAVQLVDEIVPELKKHLNDFRVLIVGRNPKTELLQKVASHTEVEVTGFVEDVRPYLEMATIFVAPIRYGSGTQNKILEAMAMEVPVIASQVVSDGLVIDEYGAPPLVVPRKQKEFACEIVRLLDDQSERSRLAEEGKRFVKSYFNWTASARKLEEICQKAVNGK